MASGDREYIEVGNKRQRTRNYNEYERNLFVDLIGKYASVIENKRTDGVSVKEKAWDSLCREFNSDFRVTKRCTKQFYVNMKRSVKNEKATCSKGMNGNNWRPRATFDGDAQYNGDGITLDVATICTTDVISLGERRKTNVYWILLH